MQNLIWSYCKVVPLLRAGARLFRLDTIQVVLQPKAVCSFSDEVAWPVLKPRIFQMSGEAPLHQRAGEKLLHKHSAKCTGRTVGTYLGLICAVKQLKVTPWVQGTAAWPMHQEQGSGLASAPGNPDPKLAADLSAGAVPLHLALSYSTRGMLSFSSSVSDLPSL